MIAYVIAWMFLAAIVIGMMTMVASVMVGVTTVGSLWSLLPLSVYALAFWLLARRARDV